MGTQCSKQSATQKYQQEDLQGIEQKNKQNPQKKLKDLNETEDLGKRIQQGQNIIKDQADKAKEQASQAEKNGDLSFDDKDIQKIKNDLSITQKSVLASDIKEILTSDADQNEDRQSVKKKKKGKKVKKTKSFSQKNKSQEALEDDGYEMPDDFQQSLIQGQDVIDDGHKIIGNVVPVYNKLNQLVPNQDFGKDFEFDDGEDDDLPKLYDKNINQSQLQIRDQKNNLLSIDAQIQMESKDLRRQTEKQTKNQQSGEVQQHTVIKPVQDDMTSQGSYMVRVGQNQDMQSEDSYLVKVGLNDEIQSRESFMFRAGQNDDMQSEGSYMGKVNQQGVLQRQDTYMGKVGQSDDITSQGTYFGRAEQNDDMQSEGSYMGKVNQQGFLQSQIDDITSQGTYFGRAGQNDDMQSEGSFMARGQNDDDIRSSGTYLGVVQNQAKKQVEIVVENTKYIDDQSSQQQETQYDYEAKKLLGKNESQLNFHYDAEEEEDLNKKMIKSGTANALKKVNNGML